MVRTELERRLEAAEKQMIGLQGEIQNLKSHLAEMQDEPQIPDKSYFEMDEKFYYLSSFTDCVEDSYIVDIDDIDFNMFHTVDYANEFRRKCLLIAMMLHCKWYLCRDFKGDYSDSNDKWVVYHCGLDNQFIATNSFHCDYGCVPFDTMENAQKCAEWLNKHWKDDGNG